MRFLQMFTSFSSGSDSLRNFYGSSTTPNAAITAPLASTADLPPAPSTPRTLFTPTPASNLLSTNTSSFIGLNNISPLPTRRYSYSGAFPSSTSIAENLSLAMPPHDSNISSLITETCQSISRSSNILNRQLSADMALSCMSLTNLIDENVESDIVKYDLLNEITTTATITPAKYSNFYTQARHLPCLPPQPPPPPPPTAIGSSSYFNRNSLMSDDYLLSKPVFSKNFNSLASSYIHDDYQYAAIPQSYNHTPQHYPHYTHYTPSQHYASNPCLSSSSSHAHNYQHYYHHPQPSHHYPPTHPMSSAFNRNYYQSHHQQPFSSRPPSITSLNRYSALAANNYSSSFNAQPYYRTSSRLDLDNTNKSSEIKRQVSFKFDVDQMSFDP
jgi:hypothetical protein